MGLIRKSAGRIFALAIVLAGMTMQASVMYQLSGMGDGFTVVLPDFIGTIYPGRTSWSFSSTDDNFVCGHQPNNCIEGIFRQDAGSVYAASISYNKFSDAFFPGLEATFADADLNSYGTYVDMAGTTLIGKLAITQTAATTAAPEPSTYALMAAGLALVGTGLYRRRRAIA